MRKGFKMSKESRLKMSLRKKGKTSPNKGKKLSLEQREKVRNGIIRYFRSKNPNYVYIPNPKDDRKWVRRERIKKYGGFHSNGEWETLKAQYNFTCPCCKKQEPEIKLTRDHIIAVSSGGSDNIENIQPLCNYCNAHKGLNTIRYF